MICHKKYLLFKESYNVELHSDKVILQNIKTQITHKLTLQEESVVDWKLNKKNFRVIGFGIQIDNKWEYFYMDEQNLTILKRFLDGKVQYHNIFQLYQIIGFVGKGAFGTVFKCSNKSNGKLVACKSIKKCNQYNYKDFLNEIFCLQNLKHPNLIQLKEFYIQQKHFYILMEFVEGDTLKTIIKNNLLDEKEKLIIVQYSNLNIDLRIKRIEVQLLSLINYFHQEGFIYRDFKPQNILFFENNIGKLRLIDFGLTIQINNVVNNNNEFCGTPGYIAPEVFNKNYTYNLKSDIFSLGVVIYELFSGGYLIQNIDPEELLIMNMIFQFNKEILSITKNQTIQKLLQGMLQEDPSLRISSNEAIDIFKQLNFNYDELFTTNTD